MKASSGFSLILLYILIVGCNSKEQVHETVIPANTVTAASNYNISILLDLSDRINPVKYPNPAMQYYQRDVAYINSVASAFTDHVKSKKIIQIDDRMQLFFDPPPLNPDINAISKDLKVSLNKANVTNQAIAAVESSYATKPLKLYRLAIAGNNYIGSDTWKFFKNKVSEYCIAPGYKNVLVILTDGYLYYKESLIKEGNETTYLCPGMAAKNGLNNQDWNSKMLTGKYGFITANPDLSNLEILVLGINPANGNPYEDEVIKAYWTKWFQAMKVKRFEIKKAELPADMDQVIKSFINKV